MKTPLGNSYTTKKTAILLQQYSSSDADVWQNGSRQFRKRIRKIAQSVPTKIAALLQPRGTPEGGVNPIVEALFFVRPAVPPEEHADGGDEVYSGLLVNWSNELVEGKEHRLASRIR